MEILCYACSQPAPEKRKKFVRVEAAYAGQCWGLCSICNIAVCNEHGWKNDNPREFQCVYCVGPEIRNWRRDDKDPDDPTSPSGTTDEFILAYSRIKPGIMDVVKKAIITYFEETYQDPDSPLDQAALIRAGEAFEAAVGGAKAKVRAVPAETAGA
jgi:hypothetical protein